MKNKMWIILLAVFIIFLSGCVRRPEPPMPPPNDNHFVPGPEGGSCNEMGECPIPTHNEIEQNGRVQENAINVVETKSSYNHVEKSLSGWFSSNQEASIMLSGFGFNNAGGPLLFNHQANLATDGKHLIVADRNNNRVLIWNNPPEDNVEPDIVLGQKNFYTNNPGDGMDELNWPVGVATDGEHLIVADTFNNRVLIWNSFPTTNGEPADISLTLSKYSDAEIEWPWAVWTNGTMLIVTNTPRSEVLVWYSIPTSDNQKPDLIIHSDDFGTPRVIGSNGSNLVIGDHNCFRTERGNFFWTEFPTEDDYDYDFYMGTTPGNNDNEILWGPTFAEGKFIALGNNLYIWDGFPQSDKDEPELIVGGGEGYTFGGSQGGDGSSIVYLDNKLYISLSNGNKIVVYKGIPTRSDQKPDYAIGAPDIDTNTLETEFIISNPVPATDGNSLFVSSDFDGKLYVWKDVPDESGAKPDFVYENLVPPWDNALYNNTLMLGGKDTIYVWNQLPRDGELPDITLKGEIGGVDFKEIKGVALDGRYFYVADESNNKVYVWKGIPTEESKSIYTLDVNGPKRISSDGNYLAVVSGQDNSVLIFNVSNLDSKPYSVDRELHFPEGVMVYNNSLFIADTTYNSVLIWNNIEDAIDGKEPDVVLGEDKKRPAIGTNTLFWPGALAFDGSHLWVGEFKFSERLLRFDVKE